jgi:Galactose mutarotase and related enzymes
MSKLKLFSSLLAIAILISCQSKPKLSITKKAWGSTDNKEVSLFTLTNTNGMEVKITNFGGIVTSIMVPDKSGKIENVVLGFDSLKSYTNEAYQKACPYFGALIGRYGNRIKLGKFKLDSVEYTLATNNAPNHLHGGIKGFDKVVWDAKEISGADSVGLELTYVSNDMEEGYPGKLTSTVTYVLTNKNELKIYYGAETDKATIINLTNHTYFNFTACAGDILNHELCLKADSITPVDSTLITTGVIAPVAGTPFDFTKAHKIGDHIGEVKGGYDHNFKLTKPTAGLTLAAELYEPQSGRFMEMYTTEPGVQFYTGNFLAGNLVNEKGIALKIHYGLCLEAQHYPDSPNKPNFPSVVLKPGEKYYQLTVYKFSTK